MRPLLPLSIVLVTALRLGLVLAGPDTDSDAYGHAMAARHVLNNPGDLTVHWVWLPLWHWVGALLALLGGAITSARLLNVALSIAPPLLLARLLRRTTGDEALATLAGCLLALMPLGLGLGSSGQPEPLFLLLSLGSLVAWYEQRFALAGLALGVATLCRYEAWVMPPVFLALAWQRRSTPREAVRASLAWVLPGLFILAWCAVHWHAVGEPLLFLRENRAFAIDASQKLGFPWGREPHRLLMAIWYPLVIPASELRWFLPGALVGVAQVARRLPPRLPAAMLGAGAVVVAFLSYGWVNRLNLGLFRHFYSITPLLATLTAAGLLALFAMARRRWPRTTRWPLLALTVALFALTRTLPVYLWAASMNRGAYPSARATAAELRRLDVTPSDRFVCDLTVVEQLTPLPWRQVIRRPVASLRPDEVTDLAPGGRLFVVAAPEAVTALRPVARVVREDADEVLLEVLTPRPPLRLRGEGEGRVF